MTRIACTCASCGANFTSTKHQIRRGDGKYCSRACQFKGASYRGRLLDALPGTITSLIERVGCSPDAVYKLIKKLVAEKECHSKGLVPSEHGGRRTNGLMSVLYERGPGADPDEPANPRAALTYWIRKLALKAMPCSQAEMVKKTGASDATVVRMLQQMRSDGLCHISAWRKAKQGPAIAVYRRGPGIDAPCDVTYESKAERNRRTLQARREKDPEYVRLKSRAAKQRSRARKFGDPLQNAFFGTPMQRKQRAVQPHGGSDE